MNQKNNIAKSIDVVLRIDGKALGGQQGATIMRQAEMIDITNKINGEWSESLAGKKSWSIICSGLYILDDKAFNALENAFMENIPVSVSVSIGTYKYNGNALITDFPLNSIFNKEFKYNIRLLGTGPLNKE